MSLTNQYPSHTLVEVKEHYEDYPYPFRNPEDEKSYLMIDASEVLCALTHWLYKGKENFRNGFRILTAGGGTGDSAIFLAEQLKNTDAEIVYLDFSQASMEIAQRRAEVRGLKNIRWVLDSILNIPNLDLGKFDYINCTGVLHHLESPPTGLQILKESLTERGGINIMVYGKYGRTGVYQMQKLMRLINQEVKHRTEEVMNAKTILSSLPKTNWFVRGQELISDHLTYGDVGIYDLFLHKQDRAYSIPELYEFTGNSGLNVVAHAKASDRLVLKVENYVRDISLLQKIKEMDKINQEAICELIVGSIIKHQIYVSNQEDSSATLDDLENLPFFLGLTNAPHLLNDILSNHQLGEQCQIRLDTIFSKNVNLSIPVTQHSKSIFKNMIGEDKSLGEIFEGMRKDLSQDFSDFVLINEAKRILTPFIEAGLLFLRDKSTPAPTKTI